ncbi:MAG: GumC family protein [Steroidobacteraceae bacterium]
MDTQLTPDFSDYLAAIKRRRFLLSAVALPILAIAVALALGLPSIYVSSSLIEFSRATVSGEMQNPQQGGMPAPAYADQQRLYADQYVANMRDAVLNANDLGPVLAQVKGLPLVPQEPDAAIGFIKQNAGMQTVRTKVLDPDTGREREIVPAFSVSFSSRNPHTAQVLAAALTKAVIEASRQNMLKRVHTAGQFYSSEAQRYHQQITALESQIADFKAKHFDELPELTNTNMGTMDRMQRDLENTELEVQQLSQNRTFLSVQLQQAETNSNLDLTTLQHLEAEYQQKEPILGENHPDLIALRRQIENLRRGGAAIEGMSLRQQLAAEQERLRTLRQSYSEAYPDVKSTERRIQMIEKRIKAGDKAITTVPDNPTVVQLKTQINSVDNQIAGVHAHQADLRRQVEQMQQRLDKTPLVAQQYDQITRGLDLARAKYDDLMKSQMDSELTAEAILGGRSDELRIVNNPIVPDRPAKPRRAAFVVVGAILAFVLSLSAVVLAESLDQTVRGSRDVRRVLALAPLAVIPRIQDAISLRRQRMKAAALACTVVLTGVIAVIAVSGFM